MQILLDTNLNWYESDLIVSEGLDVLLMDVVRTNLYGSIDNNIYMKIPEGFKLLEASSTKPRSMH